MDTANTFHFIPYSLMLQLELTAMECFKRTSPGELGQFPIKGECDHKAWGPCGEAKAQHIFLAALSYLLCPLLLYIRAELMYIGL